jgi:hypothetical protein
MDSLLKIQFLFEVNSLKTITKYKFCYETLQNWTLKSKNALAMSKHKWI